MYFPFAPRVLFCGVFCAALAACNPSPSQPLVPPGTPSAVDIVGQLPVPNPPSNLSLKDQIAQLEKSGQLPNLDRSDSVLGPDINNNGIRDDIEAFIASLQLPDKQAKAALQSAKAMQLTLSVDTSDKAAVQRVGEISMASTNCLFDSIPDGQIANQLGLAIESKTANTKIRVTKYLAYNSASSGSSTSSPSGDTCEK